MSPVADVLARATEGYIQVPAGKVWYQSVGEGEPLIILHGGPGATSIYLEKLMVMSEHGYQTVRYDQLGCGKSDHPSDTSLWTVQHFVDELEVVRQALGFAKMHLLGQSWGAFLALEYALHHPQRLQTMTLYSGAASAMQCFEAMNRLRNQLPSETVSRMQRYEAAGDYENPEYLGDVQILLDRHLCRIKPWPDEMISAMGQMAAPVYNTMWGPNEFTLTGTLASWDRRDRLDEIDVPTLIVCGRYDEVIPECSETLHAGIRGSRLEIFERSSHHAHLEEPERFFPLLIEFLRSNPITD